MPWYGYKAIWLSPISGIGLLQTVNLLLYAEDLLQLPDQGSKIPFPGLFLYTANMPVVMLSNVCTLLGLVNGAAGTAVGIVIDPESMSFPHLIRLKYI
jgi:hypothetical protein